MVERHQLDRDDWAVKALSGLGEVYHGTGNIEGAIGAFEPAIVLGNRIGLNLSRLITIYRWTAESFFWLGQYDKVIQYGEAGLKLLGEDTESTAAAQMNCMIALGSLYAGDLTKAMEYNRKNMSFVNSLDYSMELSGVYNLIIDRVLDYDRDPDGAWKWTEELEKRAIQHNELEGRSVVYRFRSFILQDKGDYKSAILSIQENFHIRQRLGDKKGVSGYHAFVAEMLFVLGNLDAAEMHLNMSMELFEHFEGAYQGSSRYEDLGHIAMSKNDWDKSISYYQKSLDEYGESAGRYLMLGRAHLKKGEYHRAIQFFEKSDDSAALAGMEEAYMALGNPEQFIEYCKFSDRLHSGRDQLYLKSVVSFIDLQHLHVTDCFDIEVIDSLWNWVDEFRDCTYRIIDTGGLEICAANGRDMCNVNLSAPRLMREISGDFVIEVCILPSSDDKPQIGGLLIWSNRDNFLRFERGTRGQHEMRLQGYVDGEWQVAGRGMLLADEDQEVHLRLEHLGNEFSAYCSTDEQNWSTCGKMILPMDDPIQVGIHAIGMIDRTIYCGAYKEGTATVFRKFRIWTR